MNSQYPGSSFPVSGSQLKPKGRLVLVISLVVFVLLFFGAAGFGFWAFGERNDYKNNVDKKITEATNKAVDASKAVQEKEFAEREKSPFKKYEGPEKYGSVIIKYPKTWSVYVDESGDANAPLSGYFNPGYVPGIQAETSTFALRLEVTDEQYDEILKQYDDATQSGDVKVTPIKAVNVKNVTGVRVDGQLEENKRGSIVIFPLRDKTLKLTVESEKYVNDFNEIILKNMSFSP